MVIIAQAKAGEGEGTISMGKTSENKAAAIWRHLNVSNGLGVDWEILLSWYGRDQGYLRMPELKAVKLKHPMW